ncbi:WYL domain-containing protein [Marinomonas sp. 15G1-11]|uniref:WYL domain-containing protein n=1 Tax=Marinomonas phaeophyticola TaxID=3004091 RepID=A0ABT4JSS0_9GAMM|nr:WYL domain-containing protein [Marinomonas sp. 15G1-11]MCZ2721385.1 WYL domain-containing protein [Marinomonas sp. 15G1-11]
MSRANTTRHLDRLEQLTAILKSEDALTTKRIAAELNISERTLFRDIGLLRERGLPIEADKGRGGGIKLHRNWGVGRLSLENQEVIDLLISLAISESMGQTLFMGNIQRVRNKLMASFSPKQKEKIHQLRQRIHIGAQASPETLSSFHHQHEANTVKANPTIEKIHNAFMFHQRLRIVYKDFHDKETQRDIEAHYLYLGFPIWYLLAWDHLRNDVRIFRYDRIIKAEIKPQEFTVRPLEDFSAILTQQDVKTL